MLSTLAPALASASQPGGLPVDSLNWPKADLTQVSPAEYLLTTCYPCAASTRPTEVSDVRNVVAAWWGGACL